MQDAGNNLKKLHLKGIGYNTMYVYYWVLIFCCAVGRERIVESWRGVLVALTP